MVAAHKARQPMHNTDDSLSAHNWPANPEAFCWKEISKTAI